MEDSGEGEERRSNWAELTNVCLIDIFSRLTPENRWNSAMSVCKSWLEACKDPTLNTVVNLEPRFESTEDSPGLWTPEFERRVDAMLRSIVEWSDGSLKEIRVRHCSDFSLSFAAERCTGLEILSIMSSARVTDECMSRVAFNCPKLTELDVSYCHEISHESLALIGKSCPNLKTLRRNLMNWLDPSQYTEIVPLDYLNACPQDGDSEAAAIGKYMPNLKHLEIRFSKITVNGINFICQGCPSLEYLDVSGCANVTGGDIDIAVENLKNLEVIKKVNYYIPRMAVHLERYGHWSLYDARFQMDNFRI
ncbi:F-box protein SKIP1-like [Impatiens glandulifera]|uniref:F-box protein SKIP1-like n=1 Tax=Impatiens glandulifera TaxID=253017 RepID=UPI001FB07AD9|nr:F-box protein SKIP1-like [Impatiens glandulifera]